MLIFAVLSKHTHTQRQTNRCFVKLKKNNAILKIIFDNKHSPNTQREEHKIKKLLLF